MIDPWIGEELLGESAGALGSSRRFAFVDEGNNGSAGRDIFHASPRMGDQTGSQGGREPGIEGNRFFS